MPKQTIIIEDFAKLDIRSGLVRSAEGVVGSDKLLKLTVDMGEEYGVVTILAGIRSYYPDPSVLVGNSYLFLANLAPRRMMGMESQGMLLALDTQESPTLVELPSHVKSGTLVR